LALLERTDIVAALERMGEFAAQRGVRVELLAVGGAAMVLAYGVRQSTRDVDVVVLAPADVSVVRQLAALVADEMNWPDDWLNDAAKGYLVGRSEGAELLSAPGIRVRAASVAQLLAMKLSAWRDDVDIADARRLLRDMRISEGRDAVWRQIEPFLVPGTELKAKYAFDDMWEDFGGDA
jgi:predicted nucleotidyltransferase